MCSRSYGFFKLYHYWQDDGHCCQFFWISTVALHEISGKWVIGTGLIAQANNRGGGQSRGPREIDRFGYRSPL